MKILRGAVPLAFCLIATVALAADMKDKVKFEPDYAGLHPSANPGMFACNGGHFHLRGTVQNLSGVPLHRIKVEAKAFDAKGNLLGAASDATKSDVILDNEKADIDLEFRSVTGNAIKDVDRYDVVVVRARSRK